MKNRKMNYEKWKKISSTSRKVANNVFKFSKPCLISRAIIRLLMYISNTFEGSFKLDLCIILISPEDSGGDYGILDFRWPCHFWFWSLAGTCKNWEGKMAQWQINYPDHYLDHIRCRVLSRCPAEQGPRESRIVENNKIHIVIVSYTLYWMKSLLGLHKFDWRTFHRNLCKSDATEDILPELAGISKIAAAVGK